MGDREQSGSTFGKVIRRLGGTVTGITGFVTTLVGFIKLAEGNASLVTFIFIGLGITLVWLACLYFSRFWKPEEQDGTSELILPIRADKQVQQQRRKEQQRQAIRRMAIVGLVLIPFLTAGGYGMWLRVRNLPSDEIIILVAEFDGPNNQDNRVTETILSRLKEATSNYENVKVKALEKTITEQDGSERAGKLAKEQRASIIIWGWYGRTADVVPISVNFEVLETNEYLPEFSDTASGAVQIFDVAELNSFKLQTKLSAEMNYLTLFTLGMADYADGDWIGAIALFDDALSQADQKIDMSNTYFYMGNSRGYNKDWEEALAAYEGAITIDHSHYQALNNKGNTLSVLGRNREAIASYEKAITVDSNNPQAVYNKGNALIQLKRYGEAITTFNEASIINPDYYPAFYNEGNALFILERYEEAIVAFDNALKVKADLYQALYNKSKALFNLERYEEAVSALDRALAIKSDNYEALYSRGLVLSSLERYEEAIATYNRALAIKPNSHEALSSKGTVLFFLERYEEAIATYDKVLAIEPNSYEALYSRGLVLSSLERYEEAIATYDRALAIKPNSHEALYSRGLVLSSLNRNEEAIATYDKVLAIKPDSHEALYFKGDALAELGQFEEAIAMYDKVLAIKPDKHEALYNKAYLYSLQNDEASALESLKKAITINDTYRAKAKESSLFDNIRQTLLFRELTSPQS